MPSCPQLSRNIPVLFPKAPILSYPFYFIEKETLHGPLSALLYDKWIEWRFGGCLGKGEGALPPPTSGLCPPPTTTTTNQPNGGEAVAVSFFLF